MQPARYTRSFLVVVKVGGLSWLFAGGCANLEAQSRGPGRRLVATDPVDVSNVIAGPGSL